MNHRVASKIKSLADLRKISSALKKKGKRIVQCHGVFDLLHPGHIRHFHAAKKEGDILVVTLTADKQVKRGPGRPVFNEHLRAETLASLEVTDFVAVTASETAVDAILAVRPDVYAKGQDYKNPKDDVTGKILDEARAVKSCGGRIVFTDDITFSSSNLLNNYFEIYPEDTVRYLKDMSLRHPASGVMGSLQELSRLRVLVIGDAIIDQYHYCLPMGKSAKENLVVNKYQSEESFAGGGFATANHLAQFCPGSGLLTVLGTQGSFEPFARARLVPGLRPFFFKRSGCGTTIKRRFIASDTGTKLFEICYMDDTPLPPALESKLLSFLRKNIARYDLVMIADYGHGLMTPKLIELVCAKARLLALNVQTNSANIGFNLVTKYRRADFVCIDERELRLATHDKFSQIDPLVERLSRKLRCRQMIVTRGPAGSVSFSPRGGFHRAPAFSYHVIDKVGAGDAFFAFTAPCFAAGLPQDVTSFVGNAAGSLAVQIVGNREPVRSADLMKFIGRLLKF